MTISDTLFLATSIGLFICFLGMIYCVIELERNAEVHRYRTALLDQIGEFIGEDTNYFSWRLSVFNSVPYTDMVTKFWKPLDSFYPDKRFLEKRP